MEQKELYRLNERFVKDFGVKIDPLIASSPYFEERLSQYESYRPGITLKYFNFLKEIENRFKSVDEYYEYRNDFIKRLISDQEERQLKFGLKGNSLVDYKISQENISSNEIYKDTNLNKTMISVDLKSANFQALRFFNKEIVKGCKTYEEYVATFTDYNQLANKRIRATSFGKTCNKQIYKVEKFITKKIVDIVLKYEDVSNIYCFNSDEVVFLKTDNLSKILEDINSLSKSIDIVFDIEEFFLQKVEGINSGYIKNIIDLKTKETRIDICGVNSVEFPFVLSALNNEPIRESYLYFKNTNGYLCKFIDYPKVKILE